MSTRSRSQPWFAVPLEQRIAWKIGGHVCKHGNPIAPPPHPCPTCGALPAWPVEDHGCLACDLERMQEQAAAFPTGRALLELSERAQLQPFDPLAYLDAKH